ncbi:F-box/LRR-repeat protein 12-like [Rutidosis leptorrhynchoides]|uniref:F-box/LRR-repeat protein 12-like n=1 Tax=Rutidosis leptorrhynchoides TaxID=125765 RepID=UPI003A9980DC
MEDLRAHNRYPCITNLPDLPLELIFLKLKKQVDRNSFGLTCHSFLEVQNLCQIRLYIRNYRSEWDSCMLEKLLNRFCNLQDLSLADCRRIPDSDLIKLQKIGSTLQCLSLAFCRQVTDTGIVSIASCCPLLSVICLSRCSITDSGVEVLAKSCKSLIELNLASCRDITDCGIQYISKNCRQLRALKITCCTKIVGVGLRGCSSNLAILSAGHCALDSTGVIEILSGGGLEYLNLSSPDKKSTLGKGLATIGLGYGANLKLLELQNCNFVDDNDVISISKGCPLLKEWDLSYCTKVGLRGWESIGLYCQKLQILHLNGCGEFCDRGLLSLGNGCKRMSVIYMANCSRITSDGISAFKLQRQDVKIETNLDMGTIFPRWRFTWPFAKCFWF